MNLFRKETIYVDGLDSAIDNNYSFVISPFSAIQNENELTNEDVIEADVTFLPYNKFENLGEISEEEINILKKFNII